MHVPVTSLNADEFSKLFHLQTQRQTFSKVSINDSMTSSLKYISNYITLSNICVMLKDWAIQSLKTVAEKLPIYLSEQLLHGNDNKSSLMRLVCRQVSWTVLILRRQDQDSRNKSKTETVAVKTETKTKTVEILTRDWDQWFEWISDSSYFQCFELGWVTGRASGVGVERNSCHLFP